MWRFLLVIFFIESCRTKSYLFKTKKDKDFLVKTKGKHGHKEESNDEEESDLHEEDSGHDYVLGNSDESLSKLREEIQNIAKGLRPRVGNIRLDESALQEIMSRNSVEETTEPSYINRYGDSSMEAWIKFLKSLRHLNPNN